MGSDADLHRLALHLFASDDGTEAQPQPIYLGPNLAGGQPNPRGPFVDRPRQGELRTLLPLASTRQVTANADFRPTLSPIGGA